MKPSSRNLFMKWLTPSSRSDHLGEYFLTDLCHDRLRYWRTVLPTVLWLIWVALMTVQWEDISCLEGRSGDKGRECLRVFPRRDGHFVRVTRGSSRTLSSWLNSHLANLAWAYVPATTSWT